MTNDEIPNHAGNPKHETRKSRVLSDDLGAEHSALHFLVEFGSISGVMATGPFQYNPETREFTRRGSARNWPVEDGAAAELPSLSTDTLAVESSERFEAPSGAMVNPAPIRRRRRSYAASETPPAKKTKLWRVAMWGLILFLLVGWLVMIAVLTQRSGSGADTDRQFEFDRGDAAEPNPMRSE